MHLYSQAKAVCLGNRCPLRSPLPQTAGTLQVFKAVKKVRLLQNPTVVETSRGSCPLKVDKSSWSTTAITFRLQNSEKESLNYYS